MTGTPTSRHRPPRHRPPSGAHEPHGPDAPRRRGRRRRRAIPAGHAILSMLIGLMLGTLVNADALMKTAEDLPFGSTKRSVAVGVMKPIHWIAETMRLDLPRARLDTALGHGPVTTVDPFALPATSTSTTATTATTTPPPTRPGETTTTTEATTTTTTAAPIRHASPKRPLRVWVAGDSLSAEYGKSLYRLAADTGEMTPLDVVDFVVSSGLSRPDKFNWPAEIDGKTKALDPEVVVLMLGSNDDQGVQSPDGATHSFGTDGWKQEYRRRVGAVMDQIIAGGRYVVYVGIPISENSGRNPKYQLINSIISDETKVRKGRAWYVDAYALFQDDSGNYAQYLPNDDGELVEMRTNDGYHLQRAGADRLAKLTLQVIARPFAIDSYRGNHAAGGDNAGDPESTG